MDSKMRMIMVHANRRQTTAIVNKTHRRTNSEMYRLPVGGKERLVREKELATCGWRMGMGCQVSME